MRTNSPKFFKTERPMSPVSPLRSTTSSILHTFRSPTKAYVPNGEPCLVQVGPSPGLLKGSDGKSERALTYTHLFAEDSGEPRWIGKSSTHGRAHVRIDSANFIRTLCGYPSSLQADIIQAAAESINPHQHVLQGRRNATKGWQRFAVPACQVLGNSVCVRVVLVL